MHRRCSILLFNFTYKLVVAQYIVNAVTGHDNVLIVARSFEEVNIRQTAHRLLELFLVLGAFVLKVPKGPSDREIPFPVVTNN